MTVATFTPSADTFISYDYLPGEGGNYGSATTMGMGHHYYGFTSGGVIIIIAAKDVGLLKFDLSSIPPSADIQNANLRFYGHSIFNPGVLYVTRCKRAWVESQATGLIYSTGNSWQITGALGADDEENTIVGSTAFDGGTTDRFISMNLAPSLIKEITSGAMTNNGFIVRGNVAGYQSEPVFVAYTKESANSDYWPLLTVTYNSVNAAADGRGVMTWF